MCLSSAGKGDPERAWRVALQECDSPGGDQCSQCENKLHRFKDPKTERFGSYSPCSSTAVRCDLQCIVPLSGLFLPEGVHVRKVNFGRLTRGVLHSKFWIVDKKHVFIGSANMDWRALTQVTITDFKPQKKKNCLIISYFSFVCR